MTARRSKRQRDTAHGDFAEGTPLAAAVDRFRALADLHENSPDDSLVRFAHAEGRDRLGADEVRRAWAQWLDRMPEPEPEPEPEFQTMAQLSDDDLARMGTSVDGGGRRTVRDGEDPVDTEVARRETRRRGEEIIRHSLFCSERLSEREVVVPDAPRRHPPIVAPVASQSVSGGEANRTTYQQDEANRSTVEHSAPEDSATLMRNAPQVDPAVTRELEQNAPHEPARPAPVCRHEWQTEAGSDRVCERCGEVVGTVEFPPGEEPIECFVCGAELENPDDHADGCPGREAADEEPEPEPEPEPGPAAPDLGGDLLF